MDRHIPKIMVGRGNSPTRTRLGSRWNSLARGGGWKERTDESRCKDTAVLIDSLVGARLGLRWLEKA